MQQREPRTLAELSEGVQSETMNEIAEFNRKLYEQNLKNALQKVENELCFKEGTFIVNCLTQYPAEELKDYQIPFRDLLHDNARIRNTHQSKKSLSHALMTTYGFEHELMEPIVKGKVKLVLVNDNSQDKEKDIIETNYEGYSNWKLIMPAKRAEGCRFVGAYHPKIWILKFDGFIRIVIGSQNLHVGDWTVWAQGMWVQDFAFNPGQQITQPKDQEFKSILLEFMGKILPKQIDFQKELELNLDDYDIKGVNIRLVTSIPGTYKGDNYHKHGSLRVMKIVSEEQAKGGFEPFKNPVVTYQSTSLGDITQGFVNTLIGHFTGVKANSKVGNSEGIEGIQLQQRKGRQEFKVIFPTHDYISNKTHGGVMFANTLWLKLETYNKNTFPKDIFHQFEGSDNYFWNAGAIPHIKVFIVTEEDLQITDKTIIYIGSHNLSQAAWGRLEKSDTQLCISNTELGVLYPPGKGTQILKQTIIDSLVFKFPPEKYGPQDAPFMQQLVKE